jgi:hypothetical protein
MLGDDYAIVIARSDSDEAIHSFLSVRHDGLLRSRSQ